MIRCAAHSMVADAPSDAALAMSASSSSSSPLDRDDVNEGNGSSAGVNSLSLMPDAKRLAKCVERLIRSDLRAHNCRGGPSVAPGKMKTTSLRMTGAVVNAASVSMQVGAGR